MKTNQRADLVAVVNLAGLPGREAWSGADMREAYAKAGKELGILIRGKIKQAALCRRGFEIPARPVPARTAVLTPL